MSNICEKYITYETSHFFWITTSGREEQFPFPLTHFNMNLNNINWRFRPIQKILKFRWNFQTTPIQNTLFGRANMTRFAAALIAVQSHRQSITLMPLLSAQNLPVWLPSHSLFPATYSQSNQHWCLSFYDSAEQRNSECNMKTW